tara:strand:- start:40446 stop:40877 length:432 start_codon:yes stop_codon:yes gene_type:complete
MKVSIGADHGGISLRESIIEVLEEAGHEVVDHGTKSKESVDYPDYAQAVGKDVASGDCDFGVLVCTSGIGMSISANKIPGVRAALIYNEDAAEYARRHNNANVICVGEKYVTPYIGARCMKMFLETPFEGGRHERRVGKIENQ